MRIETRCEKCLYDKQANRALKIAEEKQREKFLAEVSAILAARREMDSAPYVVYLFNKAFSKYHMESGYEEEKKIYNDFMLQMEEKIEEKINGAEDPLQAALVYARIGNYIDFGAMNHVDQKVLLELLEKESKAVLEDEVYRDFCRACERGENFVLLCDNCGEIVLDKLFIRQLKKRFHNLSVYAMVRGEAALNDATVEDAVYVGLDKEATVISNGNGVTGTVYELLERDTRDILDKADVILSKGQGNYETFSGFQGTVFYSFLCKCDLFTERFRVPYLTGMFIKESFES